MDISIVAIGIIYFIPLANCDEVSLSSNQTYAENKDAITLNCETNATILTSQWLSPSNEPCVKNCEVNASYVINVSNCNADETFVEQITIQMNENLFGSWKCSILNEKWRPAGSVISIERFQPADVHMVTPINIEEGQNLFQCYSTSAVPKTTRFIWYFENKFLTSCTPLADDNCSVSLNITKDMQDWTITCYAFQVYYKPMTYDFTTLDVKYPPSNVVIDIDETPLLGVEFEMNCQNEKGNPDPPIYTWVVDSDISCDSLENPTILCISSDLCSYDVTCSVSNGIGEPVEYSTKVDIMEPGVIQYFQSPSVIVFDETDPINVHCVSTGKPDPGIAIIVQDDNGIVVNGTLNTYYEGCDGERFVNDQSLEWNVEVPQRRYANGTTLRCHTGNEYGVDSVDTTLFVQYAPGKPEIELQPNIIDVGDQMTLTCELTSGIDGTEGYPVTDRYIYYNSSKFANDTSHQTIISISSVSQVGPYSCQGSNLPDVGRQYGDKSREAGLEILVQPEILSSFKEVYNPHFYQDFEIICDALGKPEPEIELGNSDPRISSAFKKVTDTIDIGYTKYGLNTSVHATFTWLDMPDTCEGATFYDSSTYTCIAKNNGANGLRHAESAPFSIITHYPPIWNGSSDYTEDAEYLQEEVNIECNVCAFPNPNEESYTWRNGSRNGEMIQQTGRVLTLNNVSYFGDYTCVVNNSIGNTAITITLLENGPPKLEDAEVTETTSMSLKVEWITRDGSNAPVNITIYFRETNYSGEYNEWPEIIQSTGTAEPSEIILDGLLCSTEYEILIKGVNSYAKENSSESSVYGTTREQPVVILDAVTVKNSFVEITWTFESTDSYFNNQYNVTVRAVYYKVSEPSVGNTNPPPEENAVNADEEYHSFHDDAITSEYVFTLQVYENGIQNEGLQMAEVTPQFSDDLGAGGIVGIIALLLVVGALATVGFLVYTERIKLPLREYEESPIIHESVNQNQEFSNPGYDAGLNNQEDGNMPVYAQSTKTQKGLSKTSDGNMPVYAQSSKTQNGLSKTSGSNKKELTNGKSETEGAAAMDDSNPYANVVVKPKPAIAPKPTQLPISFYPTVTPMKPKPNPRDLPTSREMDSDGCIYIKIGAVQFPGYRPPKKGQTQIVHGKDSTTIYATIDYAARAPTPPPEYEEEEEEDPMGILPDRMPADEDDD